MACRLVGAKPLTEPMLNIVKWTLRNKIQWNFNPTSSIFYFFLSVKKMRLKVSTVKWRLFCLGINVLKGRDYHLPFFSQHGFCSNGFGVANKQGLTFRSLWDVAVILKVHFSNSLYKTVTCEIAPRWMPQNITYMISSVNGLVLADPACLKLGQDLCQHMASLGHN